MRRYHERRYYTSSARQLVLRDDLGTTQLVEEIEKTILACRDRSNNPLNQSALQIGPLVVEPGSFFHASKKTRALPEANLVIQKPLRHFLTSFREFGLKLVSQVNGRSGDAQHTLLTAIERLNRPTLASRFEIFWECCERLVAVALSSIEGIDGKTILDQVLALSRSVYQLNLLDNPRVFQNLLKGRDAKAVGRYVATLGATLDSPFHEHLMQMRRALEVIEFLEKPRIVFEHITTQLSTCCFTTEGHLLARLRHLLGQSITSEECDERAITHALLATEQTLLALTNLTPQDMTVVPIESAGHDIEQWRSTHYDLIVEAVRRYAPHCEAHIQKLYHTHFIGSYLHYVGSFLHEATLEAGWGYLGTDLVETKTFLNKIQFFWEKCVPSLATAVEDPLHQQAFKDSLGAHHMLDLDLLECPLTPQDKSVLETQSCLLPDGKRLFLHDVAHARLCTIAAIEQTTGLLQLNTEVQALLPINRPQADQVVLPHGNLAHCPTLTDAEMVVLELDPKRLLPALKKAPLLPAAKADDFLTASQATTLVAEDSSASLLTTVMRGTSKTTGQAVRTVSGMLSCVWEGLSPVQLSSEGYEEVTASESPVAETFRDATPPAEATMAAEITLPAEEATMTAETTLPCFQQALTYLIDDPHQLPHFLPLLGRTQPPLMLIRHFKQYTRLLVERLTQDNVWLHKQAVKLFFNKVVLQEPEILALTNTHTTSRWQPTKIEQYITLDCQFKRIDASLLIDMEKRIGQLSQTITPWINSAGSLEHLMGELKNRWYSHFDRVKPVFISLLKRLYGPNIPEEALWSDYKCLLQQYAAVSLERYQAHLSGTTSLVAFIRALRVCLYPVFLVHHKTWPDASQDSYFSPAAIAEQYLQQIPYTFQVFDTEHPVTIVKQPRHFYIEPLIQRTAVRSEGEGGAAPITKVLTKTVGLTYQLAGAVDTRQHALFWETLQSFPLKSKWLSQVTEETLTPLIPYILQDAFQQSVIAQPITMHNIALMQDEQGNTLLHLALARYRELSPTAHKYVRALCWLSDVDAINQAGQKPEDLLPNRMEWQEIRAEIQEVRQYGIGFYRVRLAQLQRRMAIQLDKQVSDLVTQPHVLHVALEYLKTANPETLPAYLRLQLSEESQICTAWSYAAAYEAAQLGRICGTDDLVAAIRAIQKDLTPDQLAHSPLHRNMNAHIDPLIEQERKRIAESPGAISYLQGDLTDSYAQLILTAEERLERAEHEQQQKEALIQEIRQQEQATSLENRCLRVKNTDLGARNMHLEAEKQQLIAQDVARAQELEILKQLLKTHGIALDEDEPRVSRVSFLREQRQTDSHHPSTHDTMPTPEW